MRAIAGAVLVVAAAVCVSGAVVADTTGTKVGGSGRLDALIVIGVLLGLFGVVLLLYGLFTDRRQ